MLIFSKSPRHITIGENEGYVPPGTPPERAAHLEACKHGVVIIIPGANEIPDSDWSGVMKSKLRVVEHMIQKGELEVKAVTDYSKLSNADAVKYVPELCTLESCDSWLAVEKRAPVIKLLNAKRSELVKEYRKAGLDVS